MVRLHYLVPDRTQLSRTSSQLALSDCLPGRRLHRTDALNAFPACCCSTRLSLSAEGKPALYTMAYCGTMDLPQTACRGGQDCSTSGRLPPPIVQHLRCNAGVSRGCRQQTQRSYPPPCRLFLDRRRVAVSAEVEDRGGGQFPEMDEASELRLLHRGPLPLPSTICHRVHGSGSMAHRHPGAAVMARIEESTRIIGEIIMEVSRDVFVADAAGELTGAPQLHIPPGHDLINGICAVILAKALQLTRSVARSLLAVGGAERLTGFEQLHSCIRVPSVSLLAVQRGLDMLTGRRGHGGVGRAGRGGQGHCGAHRDSGRGVPCHAAGFRAGGGRGGGRRGGRCAFAAQNYGAGSRSQRRAAHECCWSTSCRRIFVGNHAWCPAQSQVAVLRCYPRSHPSPMSCTALLQPKMHKH